MLARKVILKLQPNHLMRFIQTYEQQVLAILKSQKGFRGEIATIAATGQDVVATSYWDSREDADAYHNSGYNEILRVLEGLVEDRPTVGVSEVVSSTFHNLARVL
jgi:heme-degrading monooxygenase HmoA